MVVVWITLLAIVVIASVLVLLRPRRRPSEPPRAPSHRTPAEPVEMATLRSYVIPERWLRSSPGKDHASAEAAALPLYSSGTVERVNEAGAKVGSWDLLRGRTRLGRDPDNHVVLDDERVSLHHALITVREGVYWLEDLGSTNGTFVGEEKRVMAAYPLLDGEEFRLGGVVLVFRGRAGDPGQT
jgi:hypothetical protein